MRTGVIAFCGSKGAGKSTSAAMFRDQYPGPTEEIAFAQHLKNVCSDVFNINMSNFTVPELKEKELDAYVTLDGKNIPKVLSKFDIIDFDYDKNVRPHIGQVFDTPRRVLQYIGTDVLHPIDPLIHAKITLKLKDPNKLSIVTDLRFLQEFQFLKLYGDFLAVYVLNKKAEMLASSDTHKSERDLQSFKPMCEVLDNTGGLNDLRKNVKGIIEKYFNQGK
jgi:hypothetical protein